MVSATFNRVILDLPDGWEDNTLITLLGPARAPLELKSHKTTEAPERPSLVLKRLPVDSEAVSLDEFAAAQEEVMKSLAPDLVVLARETLEIGAFTAVVREFAFSAPPRALRQWQAYLYAAGAFYVLCGTAANDAQFDTEKARFIEIARTLRIV